jgi:hypothetical protein
MHRLLILILSVVTVSCVLENTIDNINQETRLDLLERWALRSEIERLAGTTIGKTMTRQNGEGAVTIHADVVTSDIVVGDIQAWLVPHDPEWVFLREVLSRREQWEPLSIPLIRHCQVERRGPITFSAVPEGAYDVITVFKASEHDPSRGTRRRRHAVLNVVDGSWTCSEFVSVFSTDFKFDPAGTSIESQAARQKTRGGS